MKVYIARDSNNSLYLYVEKPTKNDVIWNVECGFINLDADIFPEIKWEDKEPVEFELKRIVSIEDRKKTSKRKSKLLKQKQNES